MALHLLGLVLLAFSQASSENSTGDKHSSHHKKKHHQKKHGANQAYLMHGKDITAFKLETKV